LAIGPGYTQLAEVAQARGGTEGSLFLVVVFGGGCLLVHSGSALEAGFSFFVERERDIFLQRKQVGFQEVGAHPVGGSQEAFFDRKIFGLIAAAVVQRKRQVGLLAKVYEAGISIAPVGIFSGGLAEGKLDERSAGYGLLGFFPKSGAGHRWKLDMGKKKDRQSSSPVPK